jgi:UDP-N-acetylenolpyruvoylglucosamine reductase
VRVAAAAGVRATSYGTSADADLRVEISSAGPGGGRARIGSAAETYELHLAVDGTHNVRNAAAAIAVAARLGVPMETSCEALEAFSGVHRRFELRGRARGADFYDDYGHVPTELAVTLEVARRREPGRLVAVFQPHRYTRTQALWRELGASLLEADVLVVTDVYGAAQEPIPGVTGKLVVDGISLAGGSGRVVYLPHRGDVVAFLDQEVRAGDLDHDGMRRCLDARRCCPWSGSGGRMSATRPAAGALARAEAILRAACGDRVRSGFVLAPLTTFRIGGPAALFLEPESDADLAAASLAIRETGIPTVVLGKGSNMLVSDGGFAGLVLRLGRGYRWSARDGNRLAAGGAMPLPALSGVALAHGLSGLEFGVAIPASLGGSVRMNAGAHGGELGDVLETVDLFRLDHGSLRIASADAGFGYRRSSLTKEGVVVGATLALRPRDPAEIRATMDDARDWRRRTQPVAEPNCGSVFKNPPGDHAARLIDEAGGKGLTVGGAAVSSKHANFIVASEGSRRRCPAVDPKIQDLVRLVPARDSNRRCISLRSRSSVALKTGGSARSDRPAPRCGRCVHRDRRGVALSRTSLLRARAIEVTGHSALSRAAVVAISGWTGTRTSRGSMTRSPSDGSSPMRGWRTL